MKTVKLISISEVKTEKQRTDGKSSRQYYTAYFADVMNPFAKQIQRNIFQSHSADGKTANWRAGNPELVKNFIGKEIPGQFVNSKVEPYQIDGRTVTTYTTVVLEGENVDSIFKQSGHPIAKEEFEHSSNILPTEKELEVKFSSSALNK